MRRSLLIGLLLAVGASVAAFRYVRQSQSEKKVEAFFESEEEEEEEKEGHQTGADKQLQSWFWNAGYPNPENLGQKYEQAWQEYLAIKENTNKLLPSDPTARTAGFGGWSSIGTTVANIGGRVVCIAINPTTTSTLVVGTASGGLYKSINSGSSWSYLPTGFPLLGVGSVAYNPSNSNVLLVGTGEVYRVEPGTDRGNIGFNVWKGRGTYGIGILRSTDGGSTWTRVMTKLTSDLFAIQEIVFDPTNSNIVYACATDGLYKSTDGGVTWPTTPLYAATYVRDIAINPTNNQQIVVSVGNLSNPTIGLFRTTNGGTSWTACSGLSAGPNGYIKLASNGTRLYASVGVGGTADELCMSNDFGATWSVKTGSSHCGGQYWFGHSLAVDPTNANKVVMGGVKYYTYTSTNTTTGGTEASISTTMHADVHDIQYVPGSSTTLYVANDGGMYKSTNGGSTFSAINSGLNAVQFYASIAVSPTDPNIIIGGLQDNGVVKWDGAAGTWSAVIGGDGGPSVFHPKDGNKVLYSNDARATFFSTNAGASETQLTKNLGYGYSPSAYDDRTAFMSPVGMSYPTTSPNTLVMYVASDNLHISTDSGLNGSTSFSRSDPSTMNRYIDAINKPAVSLAVSQTNRDKVYVSTSPLSQRADDALNYSPPAKVMRSLNASNSTSYTFSNISGTLPDRMTTDFAISKFSDDSVYITMGGFGTGHVWLTPDGGTTWLNRSNGLPDVPFNAVLIDPVRPNVIYAACDFGVYVSHNRGVNWYDFNNGFLENTMVMDLQVTADGKLVAATHGKGAFRTALFVPPATLPVNFQTFNGTHRQGMNELNWTVSEERNLKQYELGRSTDGVQYTRIATVAVNGTGFYSYTDKNLTGNGNIFYYRLKAIDRDAAYLYSDVVMLRNENPHNGLRVLGNPFTDKVNFQYQSVSDGKLSVQLFDMSGKLLRNENKNAVQGINNYAIENLGGLPQGLYTLRLQSGKNLFTEQLVKR